MNTHQKLERLLVQQARARDAIKEAEASRTRTHNGKKASSIRIQAIQTTLCDIKRKIEEVKGELQVEKILRKEQEREEKEKQRSLVKKLKEDIGYTEEPPESCATCVHFKPEISRGGEHFNPRCSLYQLKVKPNGYCNSFAVKAS